LATHSYLAAKIMFEREDWSDEMACPLLDELFKFPQQKEQRGRFGAYFEILDLRYSTIRQENTPPMPQEDPMSQEDPIPQQVFHGYGDCPSPLNFYAADTQTIKISNRDLLLDVPTSLSGTLTYNFEHPARTDYTTTLQIMAPFIWAAAAPYIVSFSPNQGPLQGSFPAVCGDSPMISGPTADPQSVTGTITGTGEGPYGQYNVMITLAGLTRPV
jgi:hypothetical protein